MEIRQVNKNSVRDKWNFFKNGDIALGNTLEYMDYLSSCCVKIICLIVMENNERIGQWTVFYKWVGKDKFLFSHAFPDVLEESRFCEIFSRALQYLKVNYRGLYLNMYHYTLLRNTDRALLEAEKFTEIHCYTTYISEIQKGGDHLKGFHESHRRNARWAIKAGYEYTTWLSADAYVRLSDETYERSGTKGITKSDIRRVLRRMPNACFLSGVYCQDRLEAASLILHWGKSAYYWHGASANDRARGATAFLHYKNMEHLTEMGVKFYDFTGSRIDGGSDKKSEMIDEFKRRFGGERSFHYSGRLYLEEEADYEKKHISEDFV